MERSVARVESGVDRVDLPAAWGNPSSSARPTWTGSPDSQPAFVTVAAPAGELQKRILRDIKNNVHRSEELIVARMVASAAPRHPSQPGGAEFASKRSGDLRGSS